MERLGIILTAEGTLETSNGIKLVSTTTKDLAKELDALSGKASSAADGQREVAAASKETATAAKEGAQGVGQLAGELARGDFKGAAQQMGELALQNQAFRASLVGTIGVATGLTAVIAGLGYAAFLGEVEERKLNDALLLTGNYAGLVGGELDAMAARISTSIGGSVRDSVQILSGLTATGKFTKDSLSEVGTAAQLVARFTGQTTEQVVRSFERMADEPAKFAAKQNEAYHHLSVETYKYIEQLDKQGRKQDAVRVNAEALTQHLGGQMATNLGLVANLWLKLGNAIDKAKQSILSIGKDLTPEEQIVQITQKLDVLAKERILVRPEGAKAIDNAMAAARTELSALQSDRLQANRLATGKSERDQATAAEIARLREKPKNAGKSAAEKEADAQNRLIAETAGLSPSFAADWDRLTEVQRNNGLTVEWLAEAQGKLLAKQPAVRAETQVQAVALRELTQIRERNNQAVERDYASQEKELDGMAKTNQQLREQAQQIGLTKEQVGTLKAARLDAVIAQERENLIVAESNEAGERQLELMRRKIALLEQQRGLTQEVTARTADADKAKAAEEYSRRFGEDIRRDLKNGLIRGMEDGKSPAKALGDTLGAIVRERLLSAFADSILNGFEPLIKQVLGRIQMPSGGGQGGGGMGGMFGGIFDSIFGGGIGTDIIPQGVAASAAEFGGGGLMDSLASFGVFHSGGMVGGAAPGARTVNPALFRGAPRFHGGGIAGNERPIIADKSEGIFTRDQMAALAPVGSGAAPVINIITPPGTKAETKQRQGANGGMQTDVIISQLEDALADRVSAGTGSLFGSMEGRFGLRTQVS